MRDSRSSGTGGTRPAVVPLEDAPRLRVVGACPAPPRWRVLLADVAERVQREVLLRHERPRPRLTVVRGDRRP